MRYRLITMKKLINGSLIILSALSKSLSSCLPQSLDWLTVNKQ